MPLVLSDSPSYVALFHPLLLQSRLPHLLLLRLEPALVRLRHPASPSATSPTSIASSVGVDAFALFTWILLTLLC